MQHTDRVPATSPPETPQPTTATPTVAPAATSVAATRPREIGGPSGPEPTRYGDWERKGRCIDF